MQNAASLERIRTVYESRAGVMDERVRRQWAAAEARAYEWGGVRAVSATIGMSPNTIRRGSQELAEREAHPERAVSDRIRHEVGGRKAKRSWIQACWPRWSV
jgi:hypothetical protein